VYVLFAVSVVDRKRAFVFVSIESKKKVDGPDRDQSRISFDAKDNSLKLKALHPVLPNKVSKQSKPSPANLACPEAINSPEISMKHPILRMKTR
jgi:hypothetical protein